MDISQISGVVENISPILDFSTSGDTLFLIIKYNENRVDATDECNKLFPIIYVALTKSYVHWKEQLLVGSSYIFNGQFFYCKDEVDGTNWYYAGNNCSFQLNQPSIPLIENKLISTRNNELLKNILISVDNILYDKAYVSLYEPNSISSKGFYETAEINITAKVYQFHKSGWVELITYDNNKTSISMDKKYPLIKNTMGLGLYMTSSQNNPFTTLNKFTTINAYSVYPMYLWGRLYGFAATVRTHITTINTSDATSDEPTEMCKKKSRTVPLNLSSEIGDRCLMFAMWRSYAVKKIFHAISFTLCENETNIVFEYMLNLCSDKGKTLYDITKRPTEKIIKEFSSPSYTELYTIRAGHDSDLLCSKMPKIWTISDVYALVNRKFSDFIGSADEDLDYNYNLKVWQGPRGDNNVGGCYWSDSLHLAQNEILIGTIECVECNDLFNFTIVRIIDLRECKIRVLISNCNTEDSLNEHSILHILANSTNEIETCYTIVIRNPLFLTEIYDHKITNVDIQVSCRNVRIVVPPATMKRQMDNVFKSTAEIVTRRTFMSEESVRFLLFSCNYSLNSYSGLESLTAIVVFKSMIFGNDRQCSMIIRDVNYADIITVYIPSANNEFKNITLGMYVRFSHCQVCVTQNRKFIYVKSSDLRVMKIEIMGFIENREHLLQLANCRSRPTKIAMLEESNRFIPFPQCPPITTVSTLYKSRKYNRSLWNLIGNITFIKSMVVSLRCSSNTCPHRKLTGIYGNFMCPFCGSNRALRPLWEAHVSFDDGSGECQLFMEGCVVTDMLTFACNYSYQGTSTSRGDNIPSFIETKKCIESCVSYYGEVQYKSYEEKNITHTTTDINIESHNSTTNFKIPSHAEGLNLLSTFIRYYCSSIHLVEITGKIMFKNNNEEFAVGTRNVNLQEVNTAKPYLAATSQFFTLSMKHVLVEVFFIKSVTGNILMDYVTQQLKSL